jgi:hypothetical protein
MFVPKHAKRALQQRCGRILHGAKRLSVRWKLPKRMQRLRRRRTQPPLLVAMALLMAATSSDDWGVTLEG